MNEVQMGISAVKVGKDISFTLSMSNTKEAAENLPFLSDAVRFGSVRVTVVSLQPPLPEQSEQGELPLDGEVTGDPFPAWEKLFAAADVPMCLCPGPTAEDPRVWPEVFWHSVEDGITATITHLEPCPLGQAMAEPSTPGARQTSLSSLDFTEMEDFHRALAKARGRKEAVELPFDGPADREEDADGEGE